MTVQNSGGTTGVASTVRFNEQRNRYELATGDDLAFADVVVQPGIVVFTHIEVPYALRQRGIGSRLIAGALDDVRRRGIKAKPLCWFVAQFIGRNPAYADLRA